MPRNREEKIQQKENRRKASVELVINLQKLFAYLICSNRKYVEPTAVLKALVDDYGNQIAFGDQKDAGEFNITFLAQINEAMQNEEDAKSPAKPSGNLDSPKRSPGLESSPGFSRSLSLGIPPILAGLAHKMENTFINDSFFGTFQVITRAQEKDQGVVELTAESPFGQIMINAMEKDVYEGWDANYFNELEGFQTPSVKS